MTGLVLALGNFDGLHLGHQELIKEAKNLAKELNCKAGLVTFSPHPSKVLRTNLPFQELITLDKKKALAESFGLDTFIVMNFSEEFSYQEPEFFIKRLVEDYQIKGLVTGLDFRFGYRRTGSAELLEQLSKDYNFIYRAIRRLQVNFCHLSSSLLRDLVKVGAMRLVKKFTGRDYSLAVQLEGNQGLLLDEDILLPPPGAFLVKKEGSFYIMIFLSRLTFHLEPISDSLEGSWKGELNLIEILGEGLDKSQSDQLIIDRLIKNAQFVLKNYDF